MPRSHYNSNFCSPLFSVEHYIPYKIKQKKETTTPDSIADTIITENIRETDSLDRSLHVTTSAVQEESTTEESTTEESKTEKVTTESPDWLEGFPEQKSEISSIRSKILLPSMKTGEIISEKVPESSSKYFREQTRSSRIKEQLILPVGLEVSDDFYGTFYVNSNLQERRTEEFCLNSNYYKNLKVLKNLKFFKIHIDLAQKSCTFVVYVIIEQLLKILDSLTLYFLGHPELYLYVNCESAIGFKMDAIDRPGLACSFCSSKYLFKYFSVSR